MALASNLILSTVQSVTRSLLSPLSINLPCIRYASKKSTGSTRNKPIRTRPKHRGWRVQDGWFVQAGTILATQLKPRFHPGLNVGFGRNATLFAIEAGRVMVTCEKINPNWDHTWVIRHYAGREGQTIYKKHFNVIPIPQHDRFKLINAF
ncbi:hypothetical protein KPH14_005017 [Odynerus spinipes]|uniref:Large ribosomal subunit protein bL27m n=1 Tax=Odynerus spinipes TaxID=1348599 RepID=A0AAD9RN15_9HYME|nr:hypothetical protein KPH14_005017 [Odynerus spinipes]